MKSFKGILWGDLTTDQDRVDFLKSGRAYDTGIIAPALIPDVIELLEFRISVLNDGESRKWRRSLDRLGKGSNE